MRVRFLLEANYMRKFRFEITFYMKKIVTTQVQQKIKILSDEIEDFEMLKNQKKLKGKYTKSSKSGKSSLKV